MKRFIILAAFAGFLATTSCKKETVVEETTTINSDGSSTTTTKTTTDYDVLRLKRAEDDYLAAEKNVEVAREKGDTKAEQIARDAADRAKEAWEVTKREVKEAGQDVKEGYNNTLEKAKAE